MMFDETNFLQGDYLIHNTIAVFAERDVKRAEELLTDYSADYNFE